MWQKPIYDRTQADVDLIKLDPTNANNKGAYNYTDLNRIENNCKYVMNLLNNSGLFYYPIIVETKTDWTMKDIPHIKDINRIRKNIITLINGVNLGDEYKEIEFSNTMDYIKANILEKDLELVKNLMASCKREVQKCNMFFCGTRGLYALPSENEVYSKFGEMKKYVGTFYSGTNGIGLYFKPNENEEIVGFIKIQQYTGLICCGKEFNL